MTCSLNRETVNVYRSLLGTQNWARITSIVRLWY